MQYTYCVRDLILCLGWPGAGTTRAGLILSLLPFKPASATFTSLI